MSKDASAEKTSLRLPQVDRVLREEVLVELAKHFRRDILTQLVREDLQRMREENNTSAVTCEPQAVAARVKVAADALMAGGVRRVINGTGVILNTNLGRAPLPLAVLDKLHELGQGYTALEIDVETGKRGERTAMISRLMSLLTGSEQAIVVNNNASSVMLAVSSLALGKEVIVSRGELIEIGGAFRLPDVVTSAGGILREVGTTNRTRVSDYKNAVNENTGLFLRCHRSNFDITGFTEQPELSDLVELSNSTGVPLAEDLGSGALFDISQLGLAYEPTVDKVVQTGVGLTMFSCDKLLGGPQAGVIAGKKELVAKLRKNPMYRALRADKLIISLIEIVLAQYLSPRSEELVPVISLAKEPVDALKKRVQDCINAVGKGSLILECVASHSALGGGSLPGKTLPSFALAISGSEAASKISASLRKSEPPVISIIQDDKVLIDFRTVLQRDEADLVEILKRLTGSII